MALSRTTLSGAVAAVDTEVLLASITGVSVGTQLSIDNESMRVTSVGTAATVPVGVYRGTRGTNVVAHPTGASVVVGNAADFAPGARYKPNRDVLSYSASGALTLPSPGRDMVAILNGTTARVMTLAVPTKDNDGDIIVIVGNGKAVHSVTVAGGIGGSALVSGTFDVGGQCSIQFIAANEIWVLQTSPLAGTLTTIDVAIA